MEHQFEVVRVQRTLRGNCTRCGKPITRSRTFSQTINPWHPAIPASVSLNNPLARTLVREATEAEANKWEPEFFHSGCLERQEARHV